MSEESFDNDKTQTHLVLTKGTMVSHYRIVEKIGAGGMGEVYLAEDTQLDRKVALKFLPPHLCQDEDCRKRFKREAQAAAKLDHPNIISVYEVSDYQGRPYFAMAHVEGKSLKEFAVGKDLTIEQILELAIQICGGLHAAHEKGVTHRDIKPSNILIDSHGRARIVDFGLASVRDADQLTKTGSTMGTVGYMSPEQVQGKEVDHRSDLFSLGVVLYELVTKQNPFRRDSEAATMKAVSDDHPEPLARFKRDIPEGMQAVIDKALEKDVTTRYQHGDGMCSDLMRVKRSLESTQTSVTGAPQEKSPLWRWIATAAILVTAGILLLITKPWVTESTSDKPEKIMLAVLPFENLGDPEDEYFADGVTDEIAARLQTVKNLRVIGRRSVKEYKDTDKSIEQIGNELGVDYLLDGTVRWQRSQNGESRARVTPQLLRVSDASSLWTEVYDEQVTELFAVQFKIATKVVSSLNVALGDSEEKALESVPTTNLEAYDYFLRAQDYYWTFSDPDEMERAISLLERAVKLDSTFMRAWVDLSKAASFLYWWGYDNRMKTLAMDAAHAGVKWDTEDAYSHLALGFYEYYCDHDYHKALKEFDLLSKRRPGNADAKAAAGYIQRRLGNWEESLALQLEAVQLEPLAGWYYDGVIGTARYMRKINVAQEWLSKATSLFPEMIIIQMEQLLLRLVTSGDPAAVLALIDSISTTHGSKWLISASEMEMSYWNGDYERALKAASIFYEHTETSSDSAEYFFRVGTIYDQLGSDSIGRIYHDSARYIIEAARESGELLNAGGGTFPVGRVYTRLFGSEVGMRAAREYSQAFPLTRDAIFGADVLLELARTYALAGEIDSAFVIVDTLLAVPSLLTVPWLRADPDFAPLRDHPRFKALIEKYENIHGT